MIDFVFFLMGSLFLFFAISFAHQNRLGNKATLAIYIIVIVMIVIIKNALGIGE